jgi:DNA primase
MAMSVFEAGLLPDSDKEMLAYQLLEEFGANNISPTRKGELIHSCLLPFGLHKNGDANPSASFNWKKLTYKCLGCGNGGGLLWFIGTMRGTGVKEARHWVEKTAGIGQIMDLGDLLRYFDELYKKQDRDLPVPHYDERVLTPWQVIHPYLTEVRNIPEQNIIDLRLGWDSERDRIILPHFDGGSLRGWQARRLNPNDPDPTKYRNSPDFPKDYTLYNYDYLAEERVIVESPMTVARHIHHLGIEATFGASVTDRQIRLISKHPKVILWFDNDKAGWRATGQLGWYLMRYCNVRVVDNPYAADAGDMEDQDAQCLVRDAVPFTLWSPPRQLICYKHRTPIRKCCGKDQ